MKKTLLALVLLVAAGVLAFYLKDSIDSRYPRSAVASLTVTADSQDLESVVLARYDWTFKNGKNASMEEIPFYEVEAPANNLWGGETLAFSFSRGQPLILNVSRSDGPFSVNLISCEDDLKVPYEKGGYLYQIHAVFADGSVLYYFYVSVI